MRRIIFIALASLAPLAHAETVKTASQPWTTNEIARAVAPLATTNDLADATNAVAQAARAYTDEAATNKQDRLLTVRESWPGDDKPEGDAILRLGRTGGYADRIEVEGSLEVNGESVMREGAEISLLQNDAGYLTAPATNAAVRAANNYTDEAATLTPIYSDTPTFSEWTCKVDGQVVIPESITYDEAGVWTFDFGPEDRPVQILGDEYSTELTTSIFGSTLTAIRTRTDDILGYQLGSQTDKPLQPKGDYASVGDIAAASSSATNYTDAARIATVEYIVSPETVRGTVYTGVSQDTELRDGKLILYRLQAQPTAAWTLNLTLADGSTTGPLYTWFTPTARLTTQYIANAIIPLVYRDGAWYVAADYNTDANNYDRNIVTYCTAAEAIPANVLAVGTDDGYYKLAAGRTFDLDRPILYCNGAQTAGKTNGNNWYSNYNGVNLATTLAGWAGDATTRGMPVYLLGSVDYSARTFTIDAQTPFSLAPRMPCYCLGWYNANANSSFCFLPSPLIDDCVRAETDPVWVAEKSQYATTNDLSVSQRVVLALTQGTNVLAVITNYNSQVNLPELSLKYLDGDNGYIEVWREGRRIDAATNALHQIEAAALATGLATKADAAWSRTTSGLGQEAPLNTTWISTATTVIAGGYEYAKTVTSNGAVWLLASNGMDLGFAQGSTNAFLSISAVDGTPIFSVEKTDSVLVGVNPSGISTVGSACVVSLPVVAPSHPFARVATNLVNAVWHKETGDGMPAGSPATVSWSGSSGAYVATVDFGTSPQGFCYFEYLQEGMTKIVNAGAMDLSGGIYYDGHLYSPTVSGTQLIFERVRND